jgi:hypothetical protein
MFWDYNLPRHIQNVFALQTFLAFYHSHLIIMVRCIINFGIWNIPRFFFKQKLEVDLKPDILTL